MQNGDDSYALHDDGADRTILQQDAANQFGLHGELEDITLCTVDQDIHTLRGASVTFTMSCIYQPHLELYN